MAAWQYFAGAGLVAALCPLHGHVAVAGGADGDGRARGARVDLCVPGKGPTPPAAARPSAPPPVRVTVPGTGRPTVHHPGRTAAPGAPPPPVRAPESRREPARDPEPPRPEATGGARVAQPPPPAPEPGPAAAPAPADAPAPPRAAAAAAPGRAVHVRTYRPAALARRGPDGMSTMMLLVVVTTPAVLAAAALRPRSKSRG